MYASDSAPVAARNMTFVILRQRLSVKIKKRCEINGTENKRWIIDKTDFTRKMTFRGF